jgi:hypothetical protein
MMSDELTTENDAEPTDKMNEDERKRVEAKLIEGLESGPAIPMTAEDWAEIRREIAERRAHRERNTT